ncbi:CopD family protein [Deinococcus sp. YIM 134068]|uniref:CopD family protein n=1 Tax=Deinococcus lichenicola TaxID=3118910 RepID=UPI002F930F84
MIPALAAANLLEYGGVVLLVGGVLARRWLTPGHPPRRWPALGLLLLVLGAGLEVGWTLRDLGLLTAPDGLAYVTDTTPGRAALTRVLGGAVLLAAELSAWPALLSVPPAAVLLWGAAGGGHGATHGPGLHTLTALHAGAMSLWLGGVSALLTHPVPTPAQARRFTPVALACVALLTVSGTALTLRHAGTLPTLPASGYGRTLLLKLALLAAALLAAALVRRAFSHSIRIRPALALETALLLGVLAATAALGTTPPPTHGGHP